MKVVFTDYVPYNTITFILPGIWPVIAQTDISYLIHAKVSYYNVLLRRLSLAGPLPLEVVNDLITEVIDVSVEKEQILEKMLTEDYSSISINDTLYTSYQEAVEHIMAMPEKEMIIRRDNKHMFIVEQQLGLTGDNWRIEFIK